ncbi:MAG TPA: hypothetical protein VGM18_17555 [Candidatus Sulfotelmatobacter sp.]|jgi:hypothetical protein
MDKIFSIALAAAVCLGTTALLATNATNSGAARQIKNSDPRLATDGAFRDGLYVGKLDLAAGRQLRPTVARWSSEGDRASFIAGYQRGYNEVK